MGQRAGRVAATFGVVLALIIAALLVVLAPHAATGLTQGAERQAMSGPLAPAGLAERPLRLVAGSAMVNGIYTNYPRSAAGAVSAAVEFMTELGSTLSPDRAATVARLVADRSYHTAADDAAASAIAARRALGLPVAGSLPPGTAAFLIPVMYQLLGPVKGSSDRLTVLLLFDYTLTAQSGIAEHVGVTAVRLTWTPATWRLLQPPGHDLAALLATPGTAGATAKGWEAMTDGM